MLVNLNASIQEATRLFIRNNVHGAPVEDKGKIVGIITYTDIAHAIAQGKLNVKVKDIMTKDLITVSPDKAIEDAATLLVRNKIKRLPVIDKEGNLIGIVSRKDIMNYLFNGD